MSLSDHAERVIASALADPGVAREVIALLDEIPGLAADHQALVDVTPTVVDGQTGNTLAGVPRDAGAAVGLRRRFRLRGFPGQIATMA